MLYGMAYVWFVLLIMAIVGLWWLGYRMEPHFISKDGRRMICTTQDITDPGRPGRIREVRLSVIADGTLVATQKQGLRRRSSVWRVEGRGPDRGKLAVFIAHESVDGGKGSTITIRVPLKSRAVAVLADLNARGTAEPQDLPGRD